MKVRLAKLPDAEALATIGKKTILETYRGMGTRPLTYLDEFSNEYFRPEVMATELVNPKNRFYLGFTKDVPVGYMKVVQCVPPLGLEGTDSLQIEKLYLDRSEQGKGIGKRFFEQCFSLGMNLGIPLIWLGVYDQNELAIAFYRRNGFRQVGAQDWNWKT